jgi:hypothetical protein
VILELIPLRREMRLAVAIGAQRSNVFWNVRAIVRKPQDVVDLKKRLSQVS